jgi:hypothetical protein
MKRFIATIAVFGPALLIVALSGNSDKPKAAASPTPIIDQSAELAAKDARIAELSEQLSAALETRAAQAVQPDDAGQRAHQDEKPLSNLALLKQPAAYIAAPRPVQSCAGGVCMPAAQGPRYQYQSRSSQPRRFVGRLFGRR